MILVCRQWFDTSFFTVQNPWLGWIFQGLCCISLFHFEWYTQTEKGIRKKKNTKEKSKNITFFRTLWHHFAIGYSRTPLKWSNDWRDEISSGDIGNIMGCGYLPTSGSLLGSRCWSLSFSWRAWKKASISSSNRYFFSSHCLRSKKSSYIICSILLWLCSNCSIH